MWKIFVQYESLVTSGLKVMAKVESFYSRTRANVDANTRATTLAPGTWLLCLAKNSHFGRCPDGILVSHTHLVVTPFCYFEVLQIVGKRVSVYVLSFIHHIHKDTFTVCHWTSTLKMNTFYVWSIGPWPWKWISFTLSSWWHAASLMKMHSLIWSPLCSQGATYKWVHRHTDRTTAATLIESVTCVWPKSIYLSRGWSVVTNPSRGFSWDWDVTTDHPRLR